MKIHPGSFQFAFVILAIAFDGLHPSLAYIAPSGLVGLRMFSPERAKYVSTPSIGGVKRINKFPALKGRYILAEQPGR